MFVFKAAVVGAGVMGGEIAQVIAAAELPVVLVDVERAAVDAGLERARAVTAAQLGKLVERGGLERAAADAALERTLAAITPATDHAALGDADLVVEAVPERMAVKRAVFAALDAATPGHAVLASNTSGLSITEIAQATQRPDRVVGLHFFWPASRMRLVEVIRGEETSPDTLHTAVNFAQALRKVPVRCEDAPGFVVNRILASMVSEAWRHQEEAGVEPEVVDQAVADSGLVPMGPFRLADMMGLDTTLKVAQDMRDAYGERFYVHQGMTALVAEGNLGNKSGRGFYEHL